MNFGVIDGLVNGTESVVFDHEVTGSAVSSISTGNILNGDEDGWYTIIIRYIAGANGSVMWTRFNNDSGNNYGTLGSTANNTTVVSAAATGQSGSLGGYCATSGRTSFWVGRMYAKSGAVRLINYSWCFDITGTTCTEIRTLSYVWNNTADNITNINFVGSGTDIGVGTRIIILKSNNFTDGTPTGVINTPYIKGCWRRIDSRILSAPASSVTFSGLDGDKAVLFYLSSSIKAANATGDIKINLNNDTGNNYGYQRLTATNTTVAAARATPSCIYAGVTGTNAYFSQHNTLLFAKQGFVRPSITQTINDIIGTTVTALWSLGQSYSVTNTNITEIDIATTTNNFDTGSQFELYGLYPNG